MLVLIASRSPWRCSPPSPSPASPLLPASLALGPCLKDWTSPLLLPPARARSTAFGLRLADAVAQALLRPSRRCAAARSSAGWCPGTRCGDSAPTSRLGSTARGRSGSPASAPAPAATHCTRSRAPGEWDVFVSRSTLPLGQRYLRGRPRDRRSGQATVPVQRLTVPVETLTVHADTAGGMPSTSASNGSAPAFAPAGRTP